MDGGLTAILKTLVGGYTITRSSSTNKTSSFQMTVTFTQTIENVWMRAKRKLKRQFGTSRDLFPSYIHEFIWRNKFARQNTFRLELLTMKHILGKVLKPKNKTYKSSSTHLEKAAEMYAGTSKQLAESNHSVPSARAVRTCRLELRNNQVVLEKFRCAVRLS
jgi:hypothetical protein